MLSGNYSHVSTRVAILLCSLLALAYVAADCDIEECFVEVRTPLLLSSAALAFSKCSTGQCDPSVTLRVDRRQMSNAPSVDAEAGDTNGREEDEDEWYDYADADAGSIEAEFGSDVDEDTSLGMGAPGLGASKKAAQVDGRQYNGDQPTSTFFQADWKRDEKPRGRKIAPGKGGQAMATTKFKRLSVRARKLEGTSAY
eukprot:gene26327-17422_t